MAKVGSPIHPPTPTHIVYAMHAYYCEGHSLYDTARKFDRMSAQSIWKCFKRHGLPLRTCSHTTAMKNARDAQTRLMYEDYKTGMSLEQVGGKYNISGAGIYARFRARGFKMRTANEMRKGRKRAAA